MTSQSNITVIYEDDSLIAINKPHGLLVHRSRMATDTTEFALQKVRKIVGRRVYPAHRLDRKTSGVLLFSKSKEANAQVQAVFRERRIHKQYLAIVRGYTDPSGTIDYALTVGNKTQAAQTAYQRIETYELPFPSGKNLTSRYSLIKLTPATGRYHQLRKHMKHIFHPILGDRPHGCNKQNKIWKERYDMTSLMLHASSLQFEYPDGNPIVITADSSAEFEYTLGILRSENLG